MAFDRLETRFCDEGIFKDIDSIELGDDFGEKIEDAVASCHVFLALIGSRWLTATSDTGRRRLDDPEDYVRLEIETAIDRKIRVIPILVDGARMPDGDVLPPSVATIGVVRHSS